MDIRLYEVKQNMKKAVEIVSADFSMIRTGRAMPSLIENIVVTTYGGAQKLRIMELGTISAPDSKTLVVQPWDTSVTADIQKAIMEANIGLNPSVDGNIVRIAFPLLTEERRAEFIKLLKQKIEAGRVMIRQIRHDKMSEIKRSFEEKILTEDDKHKLEEDIQSLTDEYIKEIEELGTKKEEELIQI